MDQIKIGSFLKELRMEKGLTQAKLAESKSEPYSDSANAANFTAFAIFSTEEKSSGNYYVYAWVIESTYSFDKGVLAEQSGSSYPCRFELTSNNNTFNVVNVAIPRDGGYYSEDINKLFPEYLREKIYNVHDDGTLTKLGDNILNEAKNYFGIK